MDGYRYSPIDPGSRQIRLLVLRPALGTSAAIKCDLILTSLDDHPLYEALSYTWGDSSTTRAITIDGRQLRVTENLDCALRDLRHRTSKRTLWIDAVCVNQADIPERNHQVRQMRQTYENAQQVLVWLGEETSDSVKALDFIKEFGTRAAKKGCSEEELERYILDTFQSKRYAGVWAALAAVLDRLWWTRAWVFQEILVASKGTVHCGRLSVPWDLFPTLAFVIDQFEQLFRIWEPAHTNNAPRTVGNYHHLYNMALYQRQRLLGGPPLLLEALQTRRSSHSTDPRDKVFSIIGVSKDNLVGLPLPPEGPHLHMDYSKSVRDIYKGVTKHLITKTGNLDVLCACQTLPADKNPHNLPSWAPDWSTPRITNPIQNPDQWGHLHFASRGLLLFHSPSPDDDDDDILRLHGICIDTISDTSTPHTPHTPWPSVSPHWLRLAIACTSAAADGTPMTIGDVIPADGSSLYFTGQSVAEAFGRTCMVDRIAELEDTEESRQQAMIARAEAVEGRAFFVTREGFMGLGPADARVGDKVCVLWGGHVPFVLREMEGEGPSHHVVIGESYVHGFMHGEAGEDMGEEWEAVRGAEMKAQEFLLR